MTKITIDSAVVEQAKKDILAEPVVMLHKWRVLEILDSALAASPSPAPAVPDAAKPEQSALSKFVHASDAGRDAVGKVVAENAFAAQEAMLASKPETQGERVELIRLLLEDAKAHREVAGDCDCRPEDTVNWQHAVHCEQAAALLSAGPARVEPLTDPEILAARMEWLNAPVVQDSAFVSGVRFAERHHGIGKDKAS